MVVLEGIEKPGNVGGILRTADGTGVAAVLLADPAVDLYNPNAIRASLGAIFTLPVAAATTTQIIEWLRRHAFRIFAARVDGAIPYHAARFQGPSHSSWAVKQAGCRRNGSAMTSSPSHFRCAAHVDSLNVSVTAAVLMYEALRQRTVK